MSDPTNPQVAVGDILYLHDRLTGFSQKDVMRWCIVTAVIGTSVRVAGRSSTRTDGVPIPAYAMDRFDRDGWVMASAVRVSLADAEASENIGKIDDHHLQQVLFFVNEDVL